MLRARRRGRGDARVADEPLRSDDGAAERHGAHRDENARVAARLLAVAACRRHDAHVGWSLASSTSADTSSIIPSS